MKALSALLLILLMISTGGQMERCEEITIPMCRGLGYNYTSMPNKFHHDTQEEAGLEVHQFWPLVKINCSDDLLFFLCSLYAPICIEGYQGQLPACYSVCERARAGCAPIMQKFGFVWPEGMNCNDFPRYGDQEHLCIDPKELSGPENVDSGKIQYFLEKIITAGGQIERCEEITIPMCRGLGYNYTSMPNKFHHDTQDEAGLEMHQFWPLVEINCSDDLLFLLCSLYAPICIEDYQGQLPACYSVCERARAGCAPIMDKFGFVWPEGMNCDDFPRYGDQEHLCIDPKELSGPETVNSR